MIDVAAIVERVWRRESSRLLGALLRITRDLDRAEDLAQDALAAALAQWPTEGVPDNPGAWLMTAAKRRAIDHIRSGERQLRAYATLSASAAEAYDEEFAVDHLEDDVLRLMFVCCHPSLTDDTRTVLTLRLVAGLTAREVARAYLTSEGTIATRISRAKRTLHTSGAAIDEPTGADRIARLASVMSVIYLLFNEGYSAGAGIDPARRSLCSQALDLARALGELMPEQPEALGLLALVCFQDARRGARLDADGELVRLEDQDRSLWDRQLTDEGADALAAALRLGRPGPYQVQAAIAACHATAASAAETDWLRIAHLYQRLGEMTPTPVVALNRAVALAMADGPAVALAQVEELATTGALSGYYLLHATRGDLLMRLQRPAEAADCFRTALRLAESGAATDAERGFLARRLAESGESGESA